MANNGFEGKIDGEGKFELYRPFWDRLKEAVAAPEVSDRLVKAVGEKRALDWYSIRDYDLGEKRDDELVADFPRDGDCVLVLSISADATASIKFDSPNSDSFEFPEYRKLRHNFSNLYLTNTEQTDKTLRLLFGRGDWEVERHHPEEVIQTMNADTVDSIHASASREANKLLALGADSMFPDGAVRNIQGGLDANKSDSPVRSDVYIAWDTNKVYVCFTAGAWTDISTPSGVIVMWSGTIANIPSGWYLCDGGNGTPDLLDRFILSVGAAEDPGGTGGSNTHTHAKGTLGADSGGAHGHSITGSTAAGSSHTHSGGSLSPHAGITQRIATDGSQGSWRWQILDGGGNQRIVFYSWYGATGGESAHTHGKGTLAASSGGSHPHTISGTTAAGDNVPVYYKLAFIMKS